ncbi:MAG: NUDIX domain-containing protein [Gemmatimonadales bacterium]
MLRDEFGRILLQRRTDFDFWGLPGGVLELNEDIETCARRELREETGLTASALRLVGVYTHPRYDVVYPNGDQVQQYTICFDGRVGGGQMRPDGVEVSHQAFFEPEAIQSLTVPVWYRHMVRDALKGGPSVFSPPYARKITRDQIANVRPYIGHDRLIGVGAAVVVVREDGSVLMVRRRDSQYWDIPAGYSELGENVAHTAIRETTEETGLDIRLERIIGVYSSFKFNETTSNGDQVKNVGTLFRATPLAGQDAADGKEIAEIAWMEEGEILGHASEEYRLFLEMALRHLRDGFFVC